MLKKNVAVLYCVIISIYHEKTANYFPDQLGRTAEVEAERTRTGYFALTEKRSAVVRGLDGLPCPDGAPVDGKREPRERKKGPAAVKVEQH